MDSKLEPCTSNQLLLCYLQDKITPIGLINEAKQFQTSNQFKQIVEETKNYNNNNNNDESIILDIIYKSIINIFENITKIYQANNEASKSLDLDVAVLQIAIIIDYTNYDPDSSIHHVLKLKCNLLSNLKLIMYFIIFTIFGKDAYKYIIDKEYGRNKALEFYLKQFIPSLNINKPYKYKKYKYFNNKLIAIQQSVQGYIFNYNTLDISNIIAQYTFYDFDEFFYIINRFEASIIKTSYYRRISRSFYKQYSRNIAFSICIPTLLFSQTFINLTNNERLMDYVHESFVEYAHDVIDYSYSHLIGLFFAYHSYYKFWSHPLKCIQFLENQFVNIDNNDNNIINDEKLLHFILELLNEKNKKPLIIFFNGNNKMKWKQQWTQKTDEYIYKKTKNIDGIFEHIIDRYLINYDNELTKSIMIILFYQILNCLLYFIDRDSDNEQINELINKMIGYLFEYFLVPQFYVSCIEKKIYYDTIELFKMKVRRHTKSITNYQYIELKAKLHELDTFLITSLTKNDEQQTKNGIDLLLDAAQLIEKDASFNGMNGMNDLKQNKGDLVDGNNKHKNNFKNKRIFSRSNSLIHQKTSEPLVKKRKLNNNDNNKNRKGYN